MLLLNDNRGQEETYAPVVQWATIRFFMTMAIMSKWHTRQLDFVLAFTQADIERDLYMKLPPGFTIPGKVLTDQERKEYVLKLEKNLYGQKQAGRVWYLHLKNNLLKLGFKPSEHDECVFYHGSTILTNLPLYLSHTSNWILKYLSILILHRIGIKLWVFLHMIDWISTWFYFKTVPLVSIQTLIIYLKRF